MTVFRDCMVDIETTGLTPDRSAMIQIAAVRFDLQSRQVSSEFFYRSLAIPPWRYWDDSTWNWWNNDKADVLRGIIARMEDPKVVISDFSEWVAPGGAPGPRFWSKPSHFDFQFISSYCRDYGVQMPFNFRKAMDLRSFQTGMAYPESGDDIQVPFVGTVHDALHDALHQIKMLFAFVDQKEGKTDAPA